MTIDGAAWFDLDDNLAVPRPHAHAPWAEDMLHGRYLAGLAAREIEAEHLGEGWVPGRLTVGPAIARSSWRASR